MKEFEFDGNWTFEIELSAFARFQNINNAYNSIDSNATNFGRLTIEIEDDLTENPDPYPQQLNAIKFIVENQDAIVNSIIQRAITEIPDIIINYGLSKDDKYQKINEEKVRNLMGFSSIFILIPSKDQISYFDVMGSCDWDEEHGLNILMHKTRSITIGGIEGNSYWDAIKDNGTYELESSKVHEKVVPKKYKAHPKYNKLKPSQEFANQTFEHSLISGHHNEIFKALTNTGEIDVNGKWESQNKTYLESACSFNNSDLVNFLLQKGADIRYAMHECSNTENFDLILQNGGDINQKDLSGNTVLHQKAQTLCQIYDHMQQDIKYGWGKFDELSRQLADKKESVRLLIQKGSNPNLKNSYQFDVYDLARNLNEENKKEYTIFLNECLRGNDSSHKRWKLWKQ